MDAEEHARANESIRMVILRNYVLKLERMELF